MLLLRYIIYRCLYLLGGGVFFGVGIAYLLGKNYVEPAVFGLFVVEHLLVNALGCKTVRTDRQTPLKHPR